MGESSLDTEYNLLESMIKGSVSKGDGREEELLMVQRTIPQTPLIEGVSGNMALEEAEQTIPRGTGMTALMEASIRTEMTIVIDKEDGNVAEESKSFMPIQDNPIDKIEEKQQKKPQVSRKEEFLIRMEVEDKMKKIKEAQRLKKAKEDEDAMRMKQEILAQVLGIGIAQPQKPPVEPKKEIEIIKEEIADDYFDGLREESKDFIEESGVSASLNDRDSSDDNLTPRQLLSVDERMNETLTYSEDHLGTFLSESSKQQQRDNQDQDSNQILSAASKNRSEYNQKYQMDKSLKSLGQENAEDDSADLEDIQTAVEPRRIPEVQRV